MTNNHFQLIVQFIIDNWDTGNAWPDFVEAMRLLLPVEGDELSRNDRWALLPGLCCQAAGGKSESTIEVSAAWILLYLAGHLVDSVEDGDKLDEIDTLGGPGSAINVANGYFLSAALMLNELSNKDHSKIQAHQINMDFYNTILEMTSGQHQDINFLQLSLKQWWRIAGAKTGSFFHLPAAQVRNLGLMIGIKSLPIATLDFTWD